MIDNEGFWLSVIDFLTLVVKSLVVQSITIILHDITLGYDINTRVNKGTCSRN